MRPSELDGMLRLVAVLKPHNSGTGAFLALADDHRQYWVKPPGNPQGSRTLVAEYVVSGIGSLIGAPVRETRLLEIPRHVRFEYAPGHFLRPSIAHASLNLERATIIDDWSEFTAYDHNRSRQAAILGLWDLCLGGDPQWLHAADDDYSIWSFDHGFWLAGEADWTVASIERVGDRAWLQELDARRLSRASLLSTAEAIRGLQIDSVEAVVRGVPLSWDTSQHEMSELARVLCGRAPAVADRLDQLAMLSPHP
uniref:hypothetical protein n=1 Tax=Pseudoclavibacter sp. RFBI5 TaxID=2080578 RepID=UPI0011B0025B|nr:hypothetical protein [Pseudoclavibacter sp. RFBI5]